jgi:eukaryotic-like serine/threonine-protein kinase
MVGSIVEVALHTGQDTTRIRLVAAISALSCLAVVVVLLLGMTGPAVAFAMVGCAAASVLLFQRGTTADAGELGGYQLVEQLGKGAMGEVWRAKHASLLRPAAIKLMRRELMSSLGNTGRNELIQRFQREVQSTATLSSPHTIEVFDFGQAADGSPYYVMELLNGLDVETLVKTYGPQPAERVVWLLQQICSSLAEAHHRGLIHRDIKPANIYVCAVGMEVDFVKVLDFGLVRDLNTEHRLTMQGATPGTPAYLAPEFILDKVDHRSDLYALGCVAYYLLTGTLVFDATTRVAMMAAHAQQQPVAPSKRTELPIPAALDELVLACLAKDPAERPQSARTLTRKLDEVPLDGAWNQERAEAWWRQHLPAIVAKGRDGH